MLGDEEHPKGTLVWILIYLVVLTGLWITTYMDVWRGR